MSSRFVKITCAAALALPLAAVASQAHAETFPGENDCNGNFSGAVTHTPHTSDNCYGIDQDHVKPGPTGHTYTVESVVTSNGWAAYCDNGNLMDKDSLDSAITNVTDDSVPNQIDSTGREVGHFQTTHTFTLLCLDDHGPAH